MLLQPANLVLKMKLLFTISYAARRISDIIGTDINVLTNEHLFKIPVYGSNSFNDVSNKLIITETIQYIRKSRRFMILEAYS